MVPPGVCDRFLPRFFRAGRSAIAVSSSAYSGKFSEAGAVSKNSCYFEGYRLPAACAVGWELQSFFSPGNAQGMEMKVIGEAQAAGLERSTVRVVGIF